MRYTEARDLIAEAIDRIHEGVVTAKGKGVLASRVNAIRKRSDAVSQAANPHMIDEAILKGAGARRSVLLRKNREAKETEDRFKTQVRITGSPQTAALYTKQPEANPMARLRTRKTEKHGVEVSAKKKDFSAAQKAVAAGEKDAGEILDVIHRKPEGTKIKVFGKGPRGTDKSIHLHRKTELGKHRYFHSNTGKEVELIKGGVGLRVLDARTKKVVLDRGNDAIWESTMHESHNMETLQRFPIGKLKRLHAKYKAKGTKEASREAANIKRMIVSRMNEEVDDEGGMAMGELKSIIANANDIVSMLKPDSQLEGWVQSKITKSADYISSVKDYLSNTPNSISEEGGRRESTMHEATSTNDPNRGRMGRKKPLVPQGMMPDETINPRTGNPISTLGKLHSRMDQLSPETRKRYRQNYGYRTRVAGRGKRLYPMAEEQTKKDKYEGQESTKSMIARLVAQRHRKLGMKVPTDVERDIDPKYKTKED